MNHNFLKLAKIFLHRPLIFTMQTDLYNPVLPFISQHMPDYTGSAVYLLHNAQVYVEDFLFIEKLPWQLSAVILGRMHCAMQWVGRPP